MVGTMKKVGLLIFLLSFLAACGPAKAISTQVPTSTVRVAPQLTSHTWYPSNILIKFGYELGLGDRIPPPPQFILYSDGQLFIHRIIQGEDGKYDVEVFKHTQLDRTGICRLLNSIEKTGLFDDPYYDEFQGAITEPITDIPSADLEVLAWGESRVLEFEPYYLNHYHRSIQEIYKLLASYPINDMPDYLPDRIAFWVTDSAYPVKNLPDYAADWPFTFPSLAELSDLMPANNGYGERKGIVLTGETAQQVYQLWQKSRKSSTEFYNYFLENEHLYTILASSLFPDEALPWSGDLSLEFNITTEPYTLTCQPSDGMLTLP